MTATIRSMSSEREAMLKSAAPAIIRTATTKPLQGTSRKLEISIGRGIVIKSAVLAALGLYHDTFN